MKGSICWDTFHGKSIDISDEHVASIFRAKKYAKQETRIKSIASTVCSCSSSKPSVDFQQTTQHYIPEAKTLYLKILFSPLPLF
jgi:hypothetical protein